MESRNREKDDFIEPDGQHYIAERSFARVSTITKKTYDFPIINILSIGKTIVSELNIALHVKHRLTDR